jgi:hypothetical protein
MTRNNDKARQEICNHIIAKYEKIEVKAGKLLFNFRCHNNSVHFAKRKGDKKLAMVVYISEGYPIVHFINYRKGVFIDNTLGEWTNRYDYYFVKWIKSEDMWNVFTIFDAFKEELGKTLSWWVRRTSDWRG